MVTFEVSNLKTGLMKKFYTVFFLFLFGIFSHIKAQTIGVGGYNTSSICSDGTISDWGDNSNGEVGDGSSFGSRAYPVKVFGLTGIIAVSIGYNHSLALKA